MSRLSVFLAFSGLLTIVNVLCMSWIELTLNSDKNLYLHLSEKFQLLRAPFATSTSANVQDQPVNIRKGGLRQEREFTIDETYGNGFEKSQHFRPVHRSAKLSDNYLTLWFHQLTYHWWSDEATRNDRTREFLQAAMDAGFTSVMGNMPWDYVERDVRGEQRIDRFSLIDWMDMACDMGLKLHVVLSMRDLPPWLSPEAHPEFVEKATPGCNAEGFLRKIQSPNMAHHEVWDMIQNYTSTLTLKLMNKFGTCVESVSPTLNNEFETKFTQTHVAMRDYSDASVSAYKQWQVDQHLSPSLESAADPYAFGCNAICEPIDDPLAWQWLGFREEFLANRYEGLCQSIKEAASQSTSSQKTVNCLLHIPEMMSTMDHLSSNAFFKLAHSPYVDELVMDSNMMLSGAPSSPSVVGMLVSAAKLYGKKVHYELATERVISCDDKGAVIEEKVARMNDASDYKPTTAQHASGVALLMASGLNAALDAGVDSIGVTNLCAPKLASLVLGSGASRLADARTAGEFSPTALIYIPYRVFSALSFYTSGVRCGSKALACWEESLTEIPLFGFPKVVPQRNGTCAVDLPQYVILQVWDELRLRHEHVAVIGDVQDLWHEKLLGVAERVFIRVPCIMKANEWVFYQGNETRASFLEYQSKHPFHEYVANEICLANDQPEKQPK